MTPRTPGISLVADVASRVSSQWGLKFFGITAFIVVFFFGYFLLLRFPFFEVTVIPLMRVDRWIPFQPTMLWVYLSLWFYVSLPPTFLRTRAELFSYGWLAGGVAVVGLVIFLCWPTSIPATTGIEWKSFPGYTWLKSVDAAQNACPSLHVAFAVFSGIWLDRILRTMPAAAVTRAINALWCLAIVYSTLATRQHVAIDAYAGAALGWIGAWYRPPALKSLGTPQMKVEG